MMNTRMFRLFFRNSAALLLLLCVALPVEAQFTTVRRREDPGPQPKNIHGVVQDMRGKPLAGAHVLIKDLKSNVTRTATTNAEGIFNIYALPPSVDYEVYAEFRGKNSEKKTISAFLNRQDNVMNFQLDVAAIEGSAAASTDDGPDFNSYDLVRLHASFTLPTGVPAPIPAVLLLHGFGEDRTVWEPLKAQLLAKGWAVMSLDLRGHGASDKKNGVAIKAVAEWKTNAHEFPQDLDPALDWLKKHPRLNNRKIVVIGQDVGANLALIAGKFPEVRTIVALKPTLSESLALAGSAQDFMPHSALILTSDEAEGNRVKAMVKDPSRVQAIAITGGTGQWIANKTVTDAIFAWLQQTY